MKSLLLCLFHVNGDEEDDEYRDYGGGNNDEHLHCASPPHVSTVTTSTDWLQLVFFILVLKMGRSD